MLIGAKIKHYGGTLVKPNTGSTTCRLKVNSTVPINNGLHHYRLNNQQSTRYSVVQTDVAGEGVFEPGTHGTSFSDPLECTDCGSWERNKPNVEFGYRQSKTNNLKKIKLCNK